MISKVKHIVLEMRLEEVGYTTRGVTSPVLHHVDFTLQAGTFTVVLGQNGSGKSTLMRCAAGLHTISRGECLWRGQSPHLIKGEARARLVAYLGQSPTPVFGFLGREVVQLSRYAFADQHEEKASRMEEAAACWDVQDLLHRRVDRLSGGEWQRLALARTWMQDAEILMLDEPTSHLDLAHRLRFFELSRAAARAGKTVLCATHDLDPAWEYADRVLVLHGGTLRADGAVQDVIVESLVREVFGEVPARLANNPQSGRPFWMLGATS
ncbi:MAG: ABC transporter ATP-binding protein [Candidatus Methylacidiphilales bacterium]